jgi:hypothetical protein
MFYVMHMIGGSQKLKQKSICSVYQNWTLQLGKTEHPIFSAQPEKLEHPVWKIGLSGFSR